MAALRFLTLIILVIQVPVMIALAPMRRAASTVWTRWLATLRSIVATPVMSMTTTLARFV